MEARPLSGFYHRDAEFFLQKLKKLSNLCSAFDMWYLGIGLFVIGAIFI